MRAFALAASLTVCLALAAGRAPADESALDSVVAMLSALTTEGIAGLERQARELNPILAAQAAPLLATMIVDSRDDALEHGVAPVPEAIRREIEDYVPAPVLERARWCSDCGGELSLQRNTFRLELAPAITLGHVIVFERREDALTDPALWVHELKHVMQFDEWGLTGFAARYIEDYAAVEHDAAEFRWEWVQRTGWLERRKLVRR